MAKKPRDIHHERNHHRTGAGPMRDRRRQLEDEAMENDVREELTMDEVADLLDGRRPLPDRLAEMRALRERIAAKLDKAEGRHVCPRDLGVVAECHECETDEEDGR